MEEGHDWWNNKQLKKMKKGRKKNWKRRDGTWIKYEETTTKANRSISSSSNGTNYDEIRWRNKETKINARIKVKWTTLGMVWYGCVVMFYGKLVVWLSSWFWHKTITNSIKYPWWFRATLCSYVVLVLFPLYDKLIYLHI